MQRLTHHSDSDLLAPEVPCESRRAIESDYPLTVSAGDANQLRPPPARQPRGAGRSAAPKWPDFSYTSRGYRGTVESCLSELFTAGSALNADVLDAVGRLRRRGVPCHVASTQERYRAAHLEGAMGLAARFERLFFSWQMGVKKLELEFFRRIASDLGQPPAALLYIDDQQMNVQAARAAGWSAELYAFGDDVASLLARHGIVASD